MSNHNVIEGWQLSNARGDAPCLPSEAARTRAESDVHDVAHASLVCATIASGRIANIDASAAIRIKGVVSILTHQNLSQIAQDEFDADETSPAGSRFWLLDGDEIAFKGQPVALVVADTPEVARLAAQHVRVEYQRPVPADVHPRPEIALEHHIPTECDAATAVFGSAGRLSIRDTPEAMDQGPDGGFGHRWKVHMTLAARAALALHRSVRLALTRQQMHDLAAGPPPNSQTTACNWAAGAPVHRERFVPSRTMSAACAA